MEELINRYKEFYYYLKRIDLEEMCKDLTREELEDIREDLDELRLRNVRYELGTVIQKKKEEEYPELLGVHNYPILNDIDFLTEKELKRLDKLLLKYKKGSVLYASSLMNQMPGVDWVSLYKWLDENNVFRREYLINCPSCYSSSLGRVTKEDKDKFDAAWTEYNDGQGNWDLLKVIGRYINTYCTSCDTELEDDWEGIGEFPAKEVYVMQLERDKSLDDV